MSKTKITDHRNVTTMTKTKIQADNVLLHRWDYESPDGLKINKEDIEIPENAAIHNDFRTQAEQPTGVAHTLRKTDRGLEADVQLTIPEHVAETATLAPAMTGETVENDEGEIFKLVEAELESIGLITTEHEDPELNQNLKQAMEENENDTDKREE